MLESTDPRVIVLAKGASARLVDGCEITDAAQTWDVVCNCGRPLGIVWRGEEPGATWRSAPATGVRAPGAVGDREAMLEHATRFPCASPERH